MRGAVLYGPGDIRFDDREMPKIVEPTDAVIRIAVTCVCGSDLWPYRGLQQIEGPTPMGHEYCGIVEEVGSAVRSIKPGQFVIGSFATSDNTCPHCHYGYQSSCVKREFISRAQAPVLRVPQADGTLVPTPGVPSDDLLPSLLTTSDVLGTGWFAADAANVNEITTVLQIQTVLITKLNANSKVEIVLRDGTTEIGGSDAAVQTMSPPAAPAQPESVKSDKNDGT